MIKLLKYWKKLLVKDELNENNKNWIELKHRIIEFNNKNF